MLTNPKVGQQVLYSSTIRGINNQRATVLSVGDNIIVQLNEVGTIMFVEVDDELIHVRGT